MPNIHKFVYQKAFLLTKITFGNLQHAHTNFKVYFVIKKTVLNVGLNIFDELKTNHTEIWYGEFS